MNSPLSQKKIASTSKFPSKDEGNDGEIRFVSEKDNLYLIRKEKEIWFKIKMEKM